MVLGSLHGIASPIKKSLQKILQIGFHLRVVLYLVEILSVVEVYPLDHSEQGETDGSVAFLPAGPEFQLQIIGGYL